jgi:hypothetical protein
MRWPLGTPEFSSQGGEGCRVGIVAIDVVQHSHQSGEGFIFNAATMVPYAAAGALSKLIDPPAALCHADHGSIQSSVPDHVMESGEDLLVSQVSRCAKENEGI